MTTTTLAHADLLVRNALIFDGRGGKPYIGDVAVTAGKIVGIGESLVVERPDQVKDADGQWLMPGLLDIHTHLDLEVELDARLPEVVRHGTTTVVVANCSLGVAFGNQRRNGEDPIVDCFARVENLPKPVLQSVAERVDWTDTASYLQHLDSLPLGPNVVPLIPHSMLRAEVMGLAGSVARDPTEAELATMEQLLDEAMKQGYAGFSTDALPFHYLSNDPHRKVRIPTQFASFAELRRLTQVVRRHERVWQATPPKDDRWQILKSFALTSGRLFGKPLKVTAVAALDVVSNRSLGRMGLVLSWLMNSIFLKGHFRLQALAAPFRVYADGIHTPLAEETSVMRELIEPDLEDRDARRALLQDPAFRQRFKATWYADKRGFSLARIKRWLGIMDDTLRRDLADMRMTERPLPCWEGRSLADVFARFQQWQSDRQEALEPEELTAFAALRGPVDDDCDFFLAMLEHFDTDLRWSVLAANDRPEVVRKLLFHPLTLPGFNDSGAHLTNMAFYDGNLRGLQIAQREGLRTVARHVARLTRVPAEFFGVDAGVLAVGRVADMVLIDPLALARYDSDAHTRLQYRDVLGHEQMVNRSDGVVRTVWIAGHLAWNGKDYGDNLGKIRMGRALRAGSGHAAQAPGTTAEAADRAVDRAA
ncbi:MAG: hypothetical protein ABF296_10345 [Oceanococcaceae bacterium]